MEKEPFEKLVTTPLDSCEKKKKTFYDCKSNNKLNFFRIYNTSHERPWPGCTREPVSTMRLCVISLLISLSWSRSREKREAAKKSSIRDRKKNGNDKNMISPGCFTTEANVKSQIYSYTHDISLFVPLSLDFVSLDTRTITSERNSRRREMVFVWMTLWFSVSHENTIHGFYTYRLTPLLLNFMPFSLSHSGDVLV